MKEFINSSEESRLVDIAAESVVLVAKLEELEREACRIIGIDVDGEEDIVERDHVMDFVWNAYNDGPFISPGVATALGDAAPNVYRLLVNIGVVVR